MGGHGGLNILPQKRWHVYRDDNRLRVLRDEREFQEALQAEREQQQRRLMHDVVTRLKRRKHEIVGESSERLSTQDPETIPSVSAKMALLEQSSGGTKSDAAAENRALAKDARIIGGGGLRTAQATPRPVTVTAPSDQKYSSNKRATADKGKTQHLTDAQSSNVAFAQLRDETPALVRPLNLNSGRVDPLGRQHDGHFNFFAAAEREVTKQHKARDRYLLQAGHSTSRQSEFSGIAKELKNIWYQSEMPSNRIAREEKEDRLPSEKKCGSVEAAAEEAKRRVLATQQQQFCGRTPSSSSAAPAKVGQHKAECVTSDSDSIDSDVCIVKECFVMSRTLNGGGGSLDKSKKTVSKADGTRSSRKERKLLKRIKRKWMLEALDMQIKLQGVTKQEQPWKGGGKPAQGGETSGEVPNVLRPTSQSI